MQSLLNPACGLRHAAEDLVQATAGARSEVVGATTNDAAKEAPLIRDELPSSALGEKRAPSWVAVHRRLSKNSVMVL